MVTEVTLLMAMQMYIPLSMPRALCIISKPALTVRCKLERKDLLVIQGVRKNLKFKFLVRILLI